MRVTRVVIVEDIPRKGPEVILVAMVVIIMVLMGMAPIMALTAIALHLGL